MLKTLHLIATALLIGSVLAEPSPDNYTIVKRWPLPAGGEGKLIVISPELATESGLTQLARKLRENTSSDKFAFISVFTSKRAAKMRDEIESNSLSEADQRFYDRHFVAQFWKGTNSTGPDEFEMHPGGIGTPSKHVP